VILQNRIYVRQGGIMDFRKLLSKYIRYVMLEEGSDSLYIHGNRPDKEDVDFSDEEWEYLINTSKVINYKENPND